MTGAALTYMLAAVAGLALGSYAVTAGLRMARGEQSATGRSRCDACGAGLTAIETLPLLSYLSLRGACRRCGAPIDRLHLVGEIGGLIVLVSAVWAASSPRAAAMTVMGLALIAAAAVDLRTFRLPNVLTLVVGICGLALAAERGASGLLVGAVAAALAGGLLTILRAVSRRPDGEVALGLGDVKLVAALALWLGAATPLMVAAASVLGLAAAPWLRGADRRMPFGPMIAASGWTLGVLVERGWWSPWPP